MTDPAGGVSPTAPDERDREVMSAIAGDRGMSSVQCDALADDLLAAGFRRSREATTEPQPEPEWEYGAAYEGDNGIEVKWFSMGAGAFTVREAAEHEVARYADPQIRLVRRVRPGPWVPVEAVEASRAPKHTEHTNGAGAVGSGVQQDGAALDRLAVAAIEDTDSPSSPPRHPQPLGVTREDGTR